MYAAAPLERTDESPLPDLADGVLADLDPEALIRSSSYCAMVHAAHQLRREIAPALADLDLSPTLYLVLGQVLSEPGSSPAELARHSAMLPQTLATVLGSAEQRGLIVRDGERGRGRPTRVTITDAGVRLLLAGWPVVHGAGAGRLSPAQHGMLQALLEQIRGTAASLDDVVVLVDDLGRDCGTHPRASVHTTHTPLHRAFSTYLVRDDGRVLLTRRSLHKRTWPGVWTNSACGHTAVRESPEQAAERRVPQELGVRPRELRVVLPDFRYRAVDASGIVENEVCPVLVGRVDPNELAPDPAEVAEHRWVTWEELRTLADRAPFLLSPWCVEQVHELGEQPW